MRHNRISDGTATDIGSFLKRIKKGSKSIRKILDNQNTTATMQNNTQVQTFHRLMDVRIGEDVVLEKHFSSWDKKFADNSIREFVFKFLNNCLPTNTRLSNFLDNHNRGCTFCLLKNRPPVTDETVLHLFFECDTTQSLMLNFFNEFFIDFNFDRVEDQKEFLFCVPTDNRLRNYFISWLRWVFLYLIWESRCRKRQYSWHSLKNELFFIMNKMMRISKKVREDREFCQTFIARNWTIISCTG